MITDEFKNGYISNLTNTQFDVYWNNLCFNSELKDIGYKTMSALKFSEAETTFLENNTVMDGQLFEHSIEYFLITGQNIDSLISMYYWYGKVTLNAGPLMGYVEAGSKENGNPLPADFQVAIPQMIHVTTRNTILT